MVEAGLAFGLDEVWVIPAQPVHRTLSGCANGTTRLHWLQTLFQDQPQVRVLDWEIRQSEATPTIATLQHFKEQFPHMIPWIMLGSDAWNGIASWQAYPAHARLCNVLVFDRVGIDPAKRYRDQHWQFIDIPKLELNSAGHCCHLQVELPNISATELRHNAEQGLSLVGKAPELIRSDIEAAYRGASTAQVE